MRSGNSGNRRGATLVLTALLMTIIIGFVGIGVDFARFYAFKAQLQTSADAGSLAGAIDLAHGLRSSAQQRADTFALANYVDGRVPFVPLDSVFTGRVDLATRQYRRTTWSDLQSNAVEVVSHQTSTYTFGGIFGGTSANLLGHSVSAVGYVGATDCLRPWGVNYQKMLDALFGAGVKPITYNLDSADVARLASGSAPLTLLLDTQDPTQPGNVAEIVVDTNWQGNASYKAAILKCAALAIGPGDTVQSQPCQSGGCSAQSVQNLCGVARNPPSFACNAKVKLAVWDTNNGLNGRNLWFHVKYIAEFTVTHYTKGTGSAPDQITGTFNNMATTGSFSSVPTPLTGAVALVQ